MAAKGDTKARAAIRADTKAPAAAIRVATAAISLMTPTGPDLKVLVATRAVRVAIRVVKVVKVDTRDKGRIKVEGRVDTLVPDLHTLRGRAAILRAVLDPKVPAVPEPRAVIAPVTPRRGGDLPDGQGTFLVVQDLAVTGHAARRMVPRLLKAARQPSASQPRGESLGS